MQRPSLNSVEFREVLGKHICVASWKMISIHILKYDIPRNILKKKLSQYLEKRRNDINIKMSFHLEQIYKFPRN